MTEKNKQLKKKLIRLNERFTKRFHGREHYEYQKRIRNAIIEAVIVSLTGEDTVEIPVELPRQSGKTTAVVDTVEFLLTCIHRYLNRPLRVGIFAPQTEQATTDFERLKIQFADIARPLKLTTRLEMESDLRIPEKWNSKTVRIFTKRGKYLGEVYIFPIRKRSSIESKTFDLLIIEESQDVDDERMKQAVFPMGASTNAPRIYVGTSGFTLCFYKKQLDTNPKAIKIKIEQVWKDRMEMAKKSNDEIHTYYKKFVDHEIEVHGLESDYVQSQYFGKWIIGSGQFTTIEEIEALKGDFRYITENRPQKDGTIWPIFVGIDTAKHPDKTVVTVKRRNPILKRGELCNWLVLEGENYEDQFYIITDWLKPYEGIQNIAIDSTGQGDFMPDMFENHTAYNLLRVKFSAVSKDEIYKNLLQVIKNKLTLIPDVGDDKKYVQFKVEMVNLEKEYKGRLMSIKHPDSPDAHDDYPDSWALCEWAETVEIQSEPNIRVL